MQKITSSKAQKTPSRHVHRLWSMRYHPFALPVIVFLVLFFVSMVAFIGSGGTTVGADDSHVVQLHVDDTVQTVPTRAKTVKDLLTRLNITVNEKDVVEPSLDAPIEEDDFTVNVYRARPVTLIENGQKTTILSAGQSPRAIAKQAGLELQPEDKVTAVTNDSVLKDSSLAQQVEIERATLVKLNLYGQLIDVRTHAKTVGDLLAERSISADNATVFPVVTTPLQTDSVVFVTDPGKDVQLIEVPIKEGTDFIEDYNLLSGSTELRAEGRPGKKVLVYESPKGQPQSKKVLQEVLVSNPVNRVMARGRKINTASVAADKQALMAAAGISPSDYQAVDFIIRKESNWRPGAQNAGGCKGLGQACPGAKVVAACPDWSNDPVCQLQFFSRYAGRYGGWQGAYRAWQANGWW